MSDVTQREIAQAQRPADDAAHLLLVDDDRRIRALLSRYLGTQGYRVTTAGDAADAGRLMEAIAFDLIILDVMMPGESGFDFAARLRRTSRVPILMLTARSEAGDRVRGLEAGADDYLSKPFEPRELSLRVASILRRVAAPAAAPELAHALFGEFRFDIERGELSRGDELIRLTDRERALLQQLARAAGEPVSREALSGDGANERTIDVQMNRLRRKIERDPANPRYIQTARGAGYRLAIERQ